MKSTAQAVVIVDPLFLPDQIHLVYPHCPYAIISDTCKDDDAACGHLQHIARYCSNHNVIIDSTGRRRMTCPFDLHKELYG